MTIPSDIKSREHQKFSEIDGTFGVNVVGLSSLPSDTATAYSQYSSSAAEHSKVIKATPGRLYGGILSNANAAARYFQFFNSTSVPADSTVPVVTIYCPAGQSVSFSFADTDGLYFSTGIVICNSTTQNSKTLGSADSLFNVAFK